MEFYKKKLKEIKIWAWAATVLPITALAGLFFLKVIGLQTWTNIALTIGAIIMFFIAVVWWWWAIWTMAKITTTLGNVVNKFDTVGKDLTEIKSDIKKDISEFTKQ